MNDPISDLIIRIKNSALAGQKNVNLPYSKIKEELSVILKKEGFLSEVEAVEDGKKKNLLLTLSQKGNIVPRIDVKRISKPGRRVYLKSKEIRKLRGIGVTILSTPKGLMTAKQALKSNFGGEIICKISFA